MRFDRPAEDLFATSSHIRVLRALVELPAGFGVSARELARRAGVSHPTALKVLASLGEQGLASIRRSSVGDEYSLNRAHILAQAVLPIFDYERTAQEELIKFLADSIRRHVPTVDGAYLFGSAAWGEMSPGSDIDVAVTCRPNARPLVELRMPKVASEVKERYGNRLSWLVGDPLSAVLEVITRRHALSPIWSRIAKEGVPIPVRVRGRTASA